MRIVGKLISVVLLALGAATVNYTVGEGDGFAHNRDWAGRRSLPEPSYALYIGGMSLFGLSAAWIGRMSMCRRAADG